MTFYLLTAKYKNTMKRTQFAFTLIELLVTLAVISILMMVALPSVRYVILNNKIASRTNAFVNTLNYARNEAITRNIAITIEPLDGDWQHGWQVPVDLNNDGTIQPEEIKIFQIDKEISLDAQGQSRVRFDERGRIVPPPGSELKPFIVCAQDYNEGRKITLRITGTIRTEHHQCS